MFEELRAICLHSWTERLLHHKHNQTTNDELKTRGTSSAILTSEVWQLFIPSIAIQYSSLKTPGHAQRKTFWYFHSLRRCLDICLLLASPQLYIPIHTQNNQNITFHVQRQRTSVYNSLVASALLQEQGLAYLRRPALGAISDARSWHPKSSSSASFPWFLYPLTIYFKHKRRLGAASCISRMNVGGSRRLESLGARLSRGFRWESDDVSLLVLWIFWKGLVSLLASRILSLRSSRHSTQLGGTVGVNALFPIVCLHVTSSPSSSR